MSELSKKREEPSTTNHNGRIELHTKPYADRELSTFVMELDPLQDPHLYMMNPRPDIIIWGQRCFRQESADKYVEGVAVVALTGLGGFRKQPKDTTI